MIAGARSGEWGPLAVGCWAWGERPFWGYESSFAPGDVVDAFVASVDAGVTLFDTAEVYGHGESEQILGWLVRKIQRPLRVASKFALLPGRSAASLPEALAASLRRLRLPRIDLYQVHWPDSSRASIEDLAGALATARETGSIGAVGVSNFGAEEMLRMHRALASRGVPLASNQVHWSLLHRAPEHDGVLAACRELGVTLLAYSPLEQGVLTGKYHGPNAAPPPPGPRGSAPALGADALAASAPLLARLVEIGAAHGVSPGAVALAWLIARGAVPIAGAKTGAQADANAAAARLQLREHELAALDAWE